MYPKFIEVHQNGKRKSVNVEGIIALIDFTDGKYKSACLLAGSMIPKGFDESYDDLKALLHDCGCSITKADPRLDTTKPLTMEGRSGG